MFGRNVVLTRERSMYLYVFYTIHVNMIHNYKVFMEKMLFCWGFLTAKLCLNFFVNLWRIKYVYNLIELNVIEKKKSYTIQNNTCILTTVLI